MVKPFRPGGLALLLTAALFSGVAIGAPTPAPTSLIRARMTLESRVVLSVAVSEAAG